MKAIALPLLLVAALSLSTAQAAPRCADEPGAKEQPRKTVKPRKKTGHTKLFGRKKESDYTRALRRNEVLREPAEESAKQ